MTSSAKAAFIDSLFFDVLDFFTGSCGECLPTLFRRTGAVTRDDGQRMKATPAAVAARRKRKGGSASPLARRAETLYSPVSNVFAARGDSDEESDFPGLPAERKKSAAGGARRRQVRSGNSDNCGNPRGPADPAAGAAAATWSATCTSPWWIVRLRRVREAS
jgi:hypothetical protein